MSAYGMKPSFTDWTGYQKWLVEWNIVYQHLSNTCRKRKAEIKNTQKILQHSGVAYAEQDYINAKILVRKYNDERIMATKMMTLRKEAVIRWDNIKKMYISIKVQYATFPLSIENARNIDFLFNKKHLEFPQLPMWILRAKGQTYHPAHVECKIPWCTKERPDDSATKGMIRIRHGNIYIDGTGMATIS